MSEKKKFTLEYELKSSPRILFSFISEPNGLSQWFADDVIFRDQVYTFTWDDEVQKAKLLSVKRIRWLSSSGLMTNHTVILKWKLYRMN